MIETYGIITFDTTHLSISAEKAFEAAQREHKLISIPQEISAGCGFCLRIPFNTMPEATMLLKREAIGYSGCYKMVKDGFDVQITVLNEE